MEVEAKTFTPFPGEKRGVKRDVSNIVLPDVEYVGDGVSPLTPPSQGLVSRAWQSLIRLISSKGRALASNSSIVEVGDKRLLVEPCVGAVEIVAPLSWPGGRTSTKYDAFSLGIHSRELSQYRGVVLGWLNAKFERVCSTWISALLIENYFDKK